MKTSPIFGWPMAEGTDARRDFPAAVDQPRTQAIETTLDNATRRVRASNARGGDAEAGINVAVPVAGPVTITAAPAGIYLATVEADYKLTGPGSPVHWTVLGVNEALWGASGMWELDTNYRQHWSWARTFEWAGGTLAVSASLRASLAQVRIFAGAGVTLTRVSA